MKKLLIAFLALTVLNVFAGPLKPHKIWENVLITQKLIDIDSAKIVVGNSDGKGAAVALSGDVTISNTGVASFAVQDEGLNAQRLAIFDYDFAVDGGAVSTIATGVTLPANSIIEQCWFRVETQLVDAGSGTLEVQCEDADNIFVEADFTGNAAGAIVAGAPLGTIATMVDDIAAACDISFLIGGAALTAGKLRGYCRYTVHE